MSGNGAEKRFQSLPEGRQRRSPDRTDRLTVADGSPATGKAWPPVRAM